MEKKLYSDLERVSNHLLQVLARLINNATSLKSEIGELKDRRAKLIDEAVEELLPDLESETLGRLSETAFCTRSRRDSFTAINNHPIGFWNLVLGRAKEIRLRVFATEFKLLKVQLRAYVDRGQILNRNHFEIEKLAFEIQSKETQLLDIQNKMNKVQAESDTAEEAREKLQKGSKPSSRFIERVTASASKIPQPGQKAYYSSTGTIQHSNDDDTDLLLWWALDIPTSGRTLVMDMMFHDHGSTSAPADPAFGGGGGFSGGGSGGDIPDAPPVQPDSTTSPSNSMLDTAAILASDANKGYS